MAKKYYMSIGYPLGLCEIEEFQRVFNVELEGEFIGLTLNDYNVWKYCFFDVKEEQDIVKAFNFDIYKSINNLLDAKLIVPLDFSDVDSVFDKLKILSPVKNGFGIGLNKDDKYEILNQGNPFIVNSDQFRVWAECDNRKLNKQIFAKLFETEDRNTKMYFINIILALKTLDLIRINKRERIKQ